MRAAIESLRLLTPKGQNTITRCSKTLRPAANPKSGTSLIVATKGLLHGIRRAAYLSKSLEVKNLVLGKKLITEPLVAFVSRLST